MAQWISRTTANPEVASSILGGSMGLFGFPLDLRVQGDVGGWVLAIALERRYAFLYFSIYLFFQKRIRSRDPWIKGLTHYQCASGAPIIHNGAFILSTSRLSQVV